MLVEQVAGDTGWHGQQQEEVGTHEYLWFKYSSNSRSGKCFETVANDAIRE